MRYVLITTWINSPILDARLQVFLCQIPFQIDRAKPVGELEAVFAEVVDDGVKDVLSDRLQRWNGFFRVLGVGINVIGILAIGLRTGTEFF